MEDDKTLLGGTSSKTKFRKSGRAQAVLSCASLVVILALLIGIGFVAGLLAGKVIYSASPETNSSSNCSSYSRWGADVTVGGKTVSVLEWLDTELKPSNIRGNLR